MARCAEIAAQGAFVLALFGGRDELIPADERREIEERLSAAGVPHELVTYPEAGHGFHCPDRPETYNEAAAADAWERILSALRAHVARARPR
jgi:carboxymethylenebutenolidase